MSTLFSNIGIQTLLVHTQSVQIDSIQVVSTSSSKLNQILPEMLQLLFRICMIRLLESVVSLLSIQLAGQKECIQIENANQQFF